jgi:hypothetical protein
MTLSLSRTIKHLCSPSVRHQIVRQPRVVSPSWACRYYSNEVSAADLEFGQPVHETHPHLIQAGHSMVTSFSLNLSLINFNYSYARDFGSGVL